MLRGRGSLQDIDQITLIKPHVKWYARPNRLRDIVPALEEAFVQAQTGVPGPVFVELAVDLLYDESIVRDWYKAKTDKKDPTIQEKIVAMYIKWHLNRVFGGSTKIQFPQPRVIKTPMVERPQRKLYHCFGLLPKPFWSLGHKHFGSKPTRWISKSD